MFWIVSPTRSIGTALTQRTLIFLQWPKGDLNFIKVLERMREKGWIYDYDFHAVAKRTFYPQDFSSLDFNSKLLRFELLEKPKEPFSLPPLWDGFKPDWFDVNLIGKRQEEPRLNLKQVANTLGIPIQGSTTALAGTRGRKGVGEWI